MGKGGGGSTQTIQKSDPWEGQQPFFKDIFARAQGAFNNQNAIPDFAGNVQAGIEPTQRIALDLAKTNAQDRLINNPQVAAADLFANSLADKAATGGFTTANNTPYTFDSSQTRLNNTINASLDPVVQRYTEQLIPQLNSAATQSGAYGGSKFNDQQQQLGREFTREAGNIAARAAYQDYDTERKLGFKDLQQRRQLEPTIANLELDLASKIPQLLGQGNDIYEQDISKVARIGEAEQAFNQEDINQQLAQDQYLKGLPFEGLERYAGLIGGSLGGTTSSSANTSGAGTGSSILSGALGGASLAGAAQPLLASALGGSFLPWGALGGPVGLGAGALLGGLAGGLF